MHLVRPWLTILALVLLLDASNLRAVAEDQGLDSDRIDIASLIEEPASPLRDVVERWSTDLSTLRRRYPLESSPVRRDRLRQFQKGWLNSLDKIDFEALDTRGKVDHVLLVDQIQHELELLNLEERRYEEMEGLLPFVEAINDLTESRRRMEPIEPKASAEGLVQLVEQIDKCRDFLKKQQEQDQAESSDADRPKPSVALRATALTNDYRSELDRWYRFYAGYDPLFSWWVEAPFQRAEQALRNHADFLRKTVAGVEKDDAIVGDPVGAEGLAADLRAERISYSPEELIAIAEREFEWCEAEAARATKAMGLGDDWHAALERVKNDHGEPGDQPRLIRELAEEAIAFIEDRDLLTIPPLAREVWRMEMMSPDRQKVSPYFLGGESIIVSFPTDEMDHEDKQMSLRSNNIHFCRATVFHEVIPGHHLQQFMTARHNTHRRPFSTPFWTEGWALYWEMRFWDEGFPETPENRVGMLFWRMHRCARIIFSLKFHLGEMTPEEAIDFLVDRVGHERSAAEAEVRRSFEGRYSPLYQAAYMLGALQFRALKEEAVDSGQMTDREFHDRVLKAGNIPVELVRALLLDEPPTEGQAPDWRFAEPVDRQN
ncbi:DUF885 family protein [soil metagenome]